VLRIDQVTLVPGLSAMPGTIVFEVFTKPQAL
jgi:hypothetical protein